jgi:hypothetical protein
MMKHPTEKGDKPMKKVGQSEIIKQLQEQFHRLQRYLPTTSCNKIRMHLVQQDAKASKVNAKNYTTKSDKTDMFNNLEVANMSEMNISGTSSMDGTNIAKNENLGSFDSSEDAASSLLSLAKENSIYKI